MPLPVRANTTCDVYRNANSPPAAPDVAAVACLLTGNDDRYLESGEGDSAATGLHFTHVLLADADADIRDGLIDLTWDTTKHDLVYVPDQNGTKFRVVRSEIVNRGTASAVRRVYLDRYLPTWPTDEL
jgi:hypothetical protein